MASSSESKLIVKSAALSAVFTVVLLVLVNYLITHSWSLSSSSSKNPPITVQGTGTVLQQPDHSTVSFTVNKTATTLQDAQNQANTFTNTIVSDLQKVSITKQDIQTTNYNSSPNYNNNGGPMMMQSAIYPRPPAPSGSNGYTVSEDVTITIHDISKANAVIDTITKDGAENVSGPNLTFSDAKQQDLENQARTKAIQNAKQKAQSMASAAGVHLGRLTKIQDNDQNYPIIRPMMMNATGMGKSVPTQINPGQNTVTASVTLSYETY